MQKVIAQVPEDWLNLTTHRLDIYNEAKAKIEFLEEFEKGTPLEELPTAFDYIRLGHPLSCLLEWDIAKKNNLSANSVISFSSQVMPLYSVLRANKINGKKTKIIYKDKLPKNFDKDISQLIYEYEFDLIQVDQFDTQIDDFTIAVKDFSDQSICNANIVLELYEDYGSVIKVYDNTIDYVKEILHVRRRESVAMTPQNCFDILSQKKMSDSSMEDLSVLEETIREITNTDGTVALGSSGLSVQYSIMMGLIDFAKANYPNKKIRFIVPPNCYGGTNDQARRVAECIESVEILDLPVDSGKSMVDELEKILTNVSKDDAIPFVIAEIPTNPRVEVPELERLRDTLKKERFNLNGKKAISPVFILDQTFCPNTKFFGPQGHFFGVEALSYVSGSKFPSGGLCTAGYVVGNELGDQYMSKIKMHLKVCDNEATIKQIYILSSQMPSMNERIEKAYRNTRSFVDSIESFLPSAKINFVSKDLAQRGFTPSVFSLDLPTIGDSDEQKEQYKRKLNLKLINMMITEIPDQSKHCVSYGQFKGCYWTIPATSTQGTTKESDKDYIVRVSVGADFDLESHVNVFRKFVGDLS